VSERRFKLPWQSAGDGADPALLLAEYPSPGALVAAADGVREAGYTRWDAHCPFPVHGLERAMGLSSSMVPVFVLVLGLAGAAAGMALQWWVSAVEYPLLVSGKPFFSWPAFVPIAFECGVLGGALGAVFGFLGLARLPRHHHPIFAAASFERMSDDAFFISIESGDPHWDAEGTARLLAELGASRVEHVDADGRVSAAAGGA
jgi:hypothetical protein